MDSNMSQKQLAPDRLQDACVLEEASIYDAMLGLTIGAIGIVLVVDAGRRLMGSVTDGDIRRAILSRSPLDSPIKDHMQRKFTAVGIAAGRAEVLDLMRARSIEQIPIVDTDGKLVGLHVMREIIGAVSRPNWAVIMAGGRGERLRPLTDLVPKPMLRVAGRPILERIVLHLVGYGIREIFLSVNYLGKVIEDHFGDGGSFGCNIRYLHEDQPLGTGGALSLLPEKPLDPVLVMNGDLVTQADIGAMLEVHRHESHAITVGAHEYAHSIPFGCLEVSGDLIVKLEEKPVLARLVNAGIYALSPTAIERVPQNQSFPITALIEKSIALGERVGVFRLTEDWIDVGQHSELNKARGKI